MTGSDVLAFSTPTAEETDGDQVSEIVDASIVAV
jgi:hypothetical protein